MNGRCVVGVEEEQSEPRGGTSRGCLFGLEARLAPHHLLRLPRLTCRDGGLALCGHRLESRGGHASRVKEEYKDIVVLSSPTPE